MKGFFFLFDKESSRNKNAEDNICYILTHFDNEVIQFYFENFTGDRDIVNEWQGHAKLK